MDTSTPIPAEAAARIKAALDQIRRRLPAVQLYREYYDGDQRLAFASDKFRTAFGELFSAFANNVCSAVVDTLADRLKLVGFGQTADGGAAWDLWQKLNLQQIAGQVHAECFTAGDSYVIVWPDQEAPTVPTFYVNTAENVTVSYDQEKPGRVQWAAKLWRQDDGKLRLNLYYADRLEKYITRGKGESNTNARSFIRYTVEGEAWPLAHKLGRVPVFHFANNAPVGSFGRSELKDVIPLQDALNKVDCDLLVAMEYVALPQRWITGVELPRDPITKEPFVPWRAGVDRIWAAEDENAHFGEFPATQLAQFLAVADGFRLDVARVSRTPLHYIIPQGGNPPSGEALKTAEQPLIAKADDRTDTLGQTWIAVMCLALLITTGRAVKPEDLQPDWKSTAPKSKKESAETGAIKKTIGVPLRQVMIDDLDYSETEADEMLAAEDTRQQQITQQALIRARADQLAAMTAASAMIGQTAGTGAAGGASSGAPVEVGDTAPIPTP